MVGAVAVGMGVLVGELGVTCADRVGLGEGRVSGLGD